MTIQAPIDISCTRTVDDYDADKKEHRLDSEQIYFDLIIRGRDLLDDDSAITSYSDDDNSSIDSWFEAEDYGLSSYLLEPYLCEGEIEIENADLLETDSLLLPRGWQRNQTEQKDGIDACTSPREEHSLKLARTNVPSSNQSQKQEQQQQQQQQQRPCQSSFQEEEMMDSMMIPSERLLYLDALERMREHEQSGSSLQRVLSTAFAL
jgi:C1A family cysteine protease